jgi:hypothetical protein
MTTLPTSKLSEPAGSSKISIGTLGYIRARIRQRAYDVVIRELKKSGITQADLARRLGKGQDVISRLLSRPRNWELDTFSDLLFGISGAVPTFTAEHPLVLENRVNASSYKIIDLQEPLTITCSQYKPPAYLSKNVIGNPEPVVELIAA